MSLARAAAENQVLGDARAEGSAWRSPALGLVLVLALVVLFRRGLALTVQAWSLPEYSHAPLLPVLALGLAWLRAPQLRDCPIAGSWLGVGLVILSLGVLGLGEVSGFQPVTQYGFVLAIWAAAYAAVGGSGLRVLYAPLVCLCLAVPLPAMVSERLTSVLQTVSATLGVAVIRVVGAHAHLAGNVIDLGPYRLEVAAACSGTRYLFPLMSFGFLCAVLFRGAAWQRWLLVLAPLPLTVLMNSTRIGVVGTLVKYFGIEQADGFLHYFEGWAGFMICVALLLMLMVGFARGEGQSLREAVALELPTIPTLAGLLARSPPTRPATGVAVVLFIAATLSLLLPAPRFVAPERPSFAAFPRFISGWRALTELDVARQRGGPRVSDQLVASYVRPAEDLRVDLWVAYAETQGDGVLMPRGNACLPGEDREIMDHGIREIEPLARDGERLSVNRAIVARGDERSLIYCWYAQRGRTMTSDFAVAWYIFRDGLVMRRSDGAVVRVSTAIDEAGGLPAAEQRLLGFVGSLLGILPAFVPADAARLRPLPGS